MRFRQKMLLVMIWLLTLSYGVGGLLLIRQNFRSSLEQYENICAESYEMLLQSVQLVNFVDIQQDFSSISTALERMNTADSLVGISLIRGDRILYQNGESKSDYDTESEFESFLFTRDGRHLYQINGVIKTNEKPLELVILYDVTPVYQARDDQLEVYHQVLIVLILIGGLAAWITSYLITKPLYKLSRTARELSSGHYDSRVNSKSHDEIGQLGSDFDNMAEKLEDNIFDVLPNDFLTKEVEVKRAPISLSVPKLDITCKSEITDIIKGTGIQKMYEYKSGHSYLDNACETPNFEDASYVKCTKQKTSVSFDEDGTVVKSITFSVANGTDSMPFNNGYQVALNQPFIYCIKDRDGLPLVLGAVNNPIEK